MSQAEPSGENKASPWSERTRQVSFLVLLGASAVAVTILFGPFLVALLFAVVTVIVAWPLYSWLRDHLGDRRAVASFSTMLVLVVVVFGPLASLVYLGVTEAVQLAQPLMQEEGRNEIQEWLDEVVPKRRELPSSLRWLLPTNSSPMEALGRWFKDRALRGLNAVGPNLLSWVQGTVSTLISTVIYLFAVFVLFIRGPALLAFFRTLIPLEPVQSEKLFGVFKQMANNLILGSLATALIQGGAATVGYAVLGLDRVFLLSLLTMVAALLPLVGSPIVWVPASVALFFQRGWPWALGLVLYGIFVISTLDNITRPLFMRKGIRVHPLLIFISIFGGIAWMGLSGLLVGPVIMAFFLSLTATYREDYLGEPPATEDEVAKRHKPTWLRRLRRLFARLRHR